MYQQIDYSKIVREGASEVEKRKAVSVMERVVKLFREDNRGRETEYYSQWSNFYLRGEDNELMLRFNLYERKLVVARIHFSTKGKGNFTKLVSILEELPYYEVVVIESIQTEGMLNYAVTRGFIQDQYNRFNYYRPIRRK